VRRRRRRRVREMSDNSLLHNAPPLLNPHLCCKSACLLTLLSLGPLLSFSLSVPLLHSCDKTLEQNDDKHGRARVFMGQVAGASGGNLPRCPPLKPPSWAVQPTAAGCDNPGCDRRGNSTGGKRPW
jgi:hypothetical protein